ISVDLSRAGAARVRSGMGAEHEGNRVIMKAFDFVPRADLAVELFDAGQDNPVLYRAPHGLGPEDVPRGEDAEFGRQVSREEADYVALPLRAYGAPAETEGGLDLALVVDTSAATDPGALAIARSMAASLLAHLGPNDRAALFAGDAALSPVAPGSGALGRVDREKSKAWLAGLAGIERGGATDLGALLTGAASQLDPKRRGAVVYIGDGQPSVGEAAPKALRERLARLPPTTRVLAAGVGAEPNVALLQSLVRGAPVERVSDAYGAARAALKLLEAAGRPVWLGASVELGPGVERVLPRELPPVGADESVLVVGRIAGPLPTTITLRGSGGQVSRRATVRSLADAGDLRRRWGEGRLAELMSEGAGRSALVDAGRRFGLVSPVTSLYVPTEREQVTIDREEGPKLSSFDKRSARWKPWVRSGTYDESGGFLVLGARSYAAPGAMEVMASAVSDDKEGGTGTRAKGEEGRDAHDKRYAVAGPADALGAQAAPPPPVPVARAALAAPEPEAEKKADLDGALAIQPGTRGGGLGGGGLGDLAKPKAAEATPAATAAASAAAASPPPPAPAGAGVGRSLGGAHSKPAGGGNDWYGGRVARRVRSPGITLEPLGSVSHEPKPCGAAADLPIGERAVLWRERVSKDNTPWAMLGIYQTALRDCEASRWDERAQLLVLLVERLPSVTERVMLWRSLLQISPAAADAVYRFLALRVQTPAELKELHEALGLQRVEPSLLQDLLKKASTAAERVTLLRGTAQRFPDDTELALLVLDAYEDAGDFAGGRAWARKLRRRVDATAHLRTSVGEYYLRLSQREQGPEAARDAEEARRTFGELVEFAPEDPFARRRLGDLLRAHGWYAEALRQYETLAELTPDDASVPLLRAAAAQGMGRTEEAVRWAEKAAAIGSPDEGTELSLAARAFASAFLGWARVEAQSAGRKDEADRLRARAARLGATGGATAGSVRFVLTWSHPELRPALWTSALGAPMPAADNLPLYGIAQAYLPASPAPAVELRLDPEDAERAARFGAQAVLTAVVNEGADDERLAHVPIGFRAADGKPRTRVVVRFTDGKLVEEAS
ncbi:MAG TPA: hypothetical protein VGK73_17360, partial [Polyangiaceae bacterium]